MDLGGVRLPRRQVIGKYCPWVYQLGQTDPGKSACTWKTHEQFEESVSGGTNTSLSFYFTGQDEPLVLSSHLAGTATAFWIGAYATNREYIVGEFVSHGGLYWRCERALPLVSGDNEVPPSETVVHWQVVRTYTVYSASTAYTVDASDL